MERPAQAPTQLPPGFRFHPTDVELVVLYLRRQALARPLPAAVIPVVHDVARLDPWDLPGACARMLSSSFEPPCLQLRHNREHFQLIHTEFFLIIWCN
jgi:hypothetical protein